MYNRYVPQADGSYRKKRVPEPSRPAPQPKPVSAPPESAQCPAPEQPSCPPPKKQEHGSNVKVPHSKQETSAGSFLRQLLPKDFDTGDLMVILLLLLMAGDCQEDRNHALLTLALYFIL